MKANSYSNFVTRPPSLGGVLLGYVYIYEFWWVTPCGAVKSALRLPPSFWYCFCLAILFVCLNLVRSSPCGAGEIRRALPILLSYPTVVGRKVRLVFLLCAWPEVVRTCHRAVSPPPFLLQHLVVIVLFAWVRYLVALPFHAYLKRNSDINSNI